jgi:hypothetical protein
MGGGRGRSRSSINGGIAKLTREEKEGDGREGQGAHLGGMGVAATGRGPRREG